MRLEDHGSVAHLVLDMPGRAANVWNQDSLDQSSEYLEQYKQQLQFKGLIITSAKSSLLAGGDLDQIIQAIASGDQSANELHERSGALAQLLRRLETCGKPVVAAINGAALGGGYELCLACHHRILSTTPKR